MSKLFKQKVDDSLDRAMKRNINLIKAEASHCDIIRKDILPNSEAENLLKILTDETVLKIEKYTKRSVF